MTDTPPTPTTPPTPPDNTSEIDITAGPLRIDIKRITKETALLTGSLAGLGCALGAFVHLDHVGGLLGIVAGLGTSAFGLMRAGK